MCGVIGDAGYAHYPATATVKAEKARRYCNLFAGAISLTRFVILTKVSIQSNERHHLWLWILTFVRMTVKA